MLKVEMDAVVKEYAMRMMASVVSGPSRLVDLPDQLSDREGTCPYVRFGKRGGLWRSEPLVR
jgi:hypothetical protein